MLAQSYLKHINSLPDLTVVSALAEDPDFGLLFFSAFPFPLLISFACVDDPSLSAFLGFVLEDDGGHGLAFLAILEGKVDDAGDDGKLVMSNTVVQKMVRSRLSPRSGD